ncbi:raffinose/stachyose/melibiose transport system permease protein [Paenibacillus sp. UNC496MF]|uniref:carbohydrate ABC transporter permease n=1 Tax=Paenibacillus sp. UNC496MF TaxID=1502753 RepID=UPI0008EB5EAA|nr:sugar ABC transporter permease [Paenibacillus sp. UNC496MF]SFI34697.1 raffinose/stachyose/melibiose transport system permease protein [Paenibacillus sp. UNC496MF]
MANQTPAAQAVRPSAPPLRSSGKRRRSSAWLNLLYVPALILFAVFIFYPFIKGVQISFTNWDGYNQDYKWIGGSNYKRIFSDPDMGRVIRNTVIYGVGSAFLQNVIGLAYALFLNMNIRTRGVVRTVIYLPVIISSLIMGYIWYFFFQYDGGAINDILLLFQDEPSNLLGDKDVNSWIITFVNTYQYLGIAMVLFLAGLQTIPKDYYEAATIDGATAISRFRHVTWPLIAPSLTVSMVLNLIGGLKLFDVIVAMTNSGPGYASASMSSIMYLLYFGREDAGYAATIGILMFVMISVVSIVALFLLRRREVHA